MAMDYRFNKADLPAQKKTKYFLEEKCLLLLCIAMTILMFIRCFFSVEFTDEAYYVSDALTIMHGNTPYAFATSLIAGQSFLPILFYKIYEFFVPDLEGIFLYSRLCYVLFRITILLAVYYLLRKELVRKHRLLLLLSMLPFMGSIIQNFSYNTIAIYCTFFVSVLLYTTVKGNGNICYIKLIISGVFSALSVFAHPVSALAVLINFGLILIYSKKKIRFLLAYCLGGVAVILAVFIPIINEVGIAKLAYGFETILFHRTSIDIGSLSSRICEIWQLGNCYLKYLWVGLVSFGGILLILAPKWDNDISKKEIWLLALGISLSFSLAAAFAFVKSISFLYIAGMLFACTSIIAFFACSTRNALGWFVMLPNILYVVFMVLFTQTAAPRFYYCIPLLIVILFVMFQAKSKAVKSVAAVLAVLFALFQGYTDYEYVYRDAPLSQLDTQVEKGVYRGIYTTAAHANDVIELESFLAENIEPVEAVQFRDCAPVAYLMCNKNICDVRTWDEMQYSYGSNDPTSMYRYYKNTENIPDVIGYVDFGRDDSLSIDKTTDEFLYNGFVTAYYEPTNIALENQTFRVQIWKNSKTFPNEFDVLFK